MNDDDGVSDESSCSTVEEETGYVVEDAEQTNDEVGEKETVIEVYVLYVTLPFWFNKKLNEFLDYPKLIFIFCQLKQATNILSKQKVV